MPRRNKIQMLNASHPAQIWGRGLLVLGVGLAMVIMMIEKIRPDVMASIHASAIDITAPITELFSAPTKAFHDITHQVSDFLNTIEDNKRLKRENAELLKWQHAAGQYAKENEQLRGLLRVVPEGQPNYITARMVGGFGQNHKHVALISAGLEDGVKKNRAVIGAEGLIGRVIEVGKQNARILLITDINANIPVVNERSGFKAILTGHRGRASLRLELADKPNMFQAGDQLVTSGDGGMIPAGIPVASITSVDGTTIFAAPLANADQSAMVTVVDYRF